MSDNGATLSGFELYKQETPMSCGAASARMVLSYLGMEVTEEELRGKMKLNKRIGILPFMLKKGLNNILREKGSELTAVEKSGEELPLQIIKESLRDDRPVIASFLAENHFRPGTLVGHYSVIIGLDEDNNEIMLANPFGWEETMSVSEFKEKAAYDAGRKTPFAVKAGKFLGLLKPHTLWVLETG